MGSNPTLSVIARRFVFWRLKNIDDKWTYPIRYEPARLTHWCKSFPSGKSRTHDLQAKVLKLAFEKRKPLPVAVCKYGIWMAFQTRVTSLPLEDTFHEDKVIPFSCLHFRFCGGTGRRARLKIWCPKGREGSTPSLIIASPFILFRILDKSPIPDGADDDAKIMYRTKVVQRKEHAPFLARVRLCIISSVPPATSAGLGVYHTGLQNEEKRDRIWKSQKATPITMPCLTT